MWPIVPSSVGDYEEFLPNFRVNPHARRPGLWITRRLTRLTEASKQLTAGNYQVDLPSKGRDEVDQLSAALGQMAATIKGRVDELTRSESLQRQYFEHARDERARLGSLLAALKTGILFVNNEGVVIYFNATFGHIWRIPPDAMLVGQATSRLQSFAIRLLRNSGGFMAPPKEAGEGGGTDTTDLRLIDHRLVTQTSSPVLGENGEQNENGDA